MPGDTPDSLAVRVQYAEHQLYPRVLADFVSADQRPEALLTRVRGLALNLPAAAEKLSHGSPGFFVEGGKFFAYFSDNHHGDSITALLLKVSGLDEADMLIEQDPDRFFRPKYFGPAGWVGVVLTDGPDWAMIEAMLSAAEARSNEQLAITERDRASEQEALAQKEKNRTQRLFDFLMDSIRRADPYNGKRDMTVLEMLSTAGKRTPEHFRDDPHLQGDMLQTVGQVLQFSGDYAASRPILEEAVTLWRKEIAAGRIEDRDRLAGALQALGSLYRGLREHDLAAPLLEQSLGIAEEIYGEEDVRTAGILGDVAALHHERGDAKAAEPLHRRQLAIYVDAYGENHELPAGALAAVGCTLASQGRFSEAEGVFRRVLKVYESLFKGVHPRIAEISMHLGAALRLQGRWDEARPHLERALDVCEQTLGREHNVTGEVLMHLGMMNASEGRHEEASQAFERVVAVREKLFGTDSRRLHVPLLMLAAEYLALGRPEDAARVRTRAQGLSEVSPPNP